MKVNHARRTMAILVPGCLAAGACHGGQPSSQELARAKRDFLEDYVEIQCKRLKECKVTTRVRDRDCVEQRMKSELSLSLMTAEHVGFDQKEARRCLDSLADAECSQIEQVPRARCWGAFPGELELGQACTVWTECGPGLECTNNDDDDTCAGVCQPRDYAELGELCTVERSCAPGLACADEEEPCVETQPLGTKCNTDIDHYAPCERPLVCGSGVCAEPEPEPEPEPAAEGEACEQAPCAQGLYCRRVDGERVCTPRLRVGADCGSLDECVEGAFCHDKCIAVAEFGEPCDADAGFSCAVGECLEGTCRYHAGLGEPCAEDNTCYSYHCRKGVCVPVCSD